MSSRPTQLDAWLAAAIEDAERRALPGLKPLLESLARSTAALRAADGEFQARGSRLTAQAKTWDPEC